MKRRITISTQTPKVSDAEISELRNFDALLDQHAKAVTRRYTFIRVCTAITFLGISMLAIVYFLYRDSGLNTVAITDVSKRSEYTSESKSVEIIERGAIDSINSAERKHKKTLLKSDSMYIDTVKAFAPVQHYKKAMPVGGYDSLYQYFKKHLMYPQEHDSIEGIVMVSFMIDRDGKVQNIRVQHSMTEAFAQEAVKLITNMPPWQPATMNTLPVASTVSIPIKFEAPRQ